MRTLVLLTTPLLLCSMLLPAAEKRFDRTFTASAGGTLTVRLDVGSVEVRGTSSGEVKITAILEGDRDAVEDYRMEAKESAGGVTFTGRTRKSFWKFWSGEDLDVQVTVLVPRSYNLRLETSGGDLSITGLDGRVDGNTSGGNIRARDVKGPLTVETSGGNLRFEDVTGDIAAETSGGNIDVRGVKGNVAVETSGGNVKVSDVDGRLRAETSGGNIHAGVTVNRGVDLSTSGGDIVITLPAGTGAAIHASTSGGTVTCDFPITMQGAMDESRLQGTVNGGGESIRARTSGGDIRIGPAR